MTGLLLRAMSMAGLLLRAMFLFIYLFIYLPSTQKTTVIICMSHIIIKTVKKCKKK